MKAMQKAQKEMEGELAKIMSPQEFEEYQLRMSTTAMTMRFQLASFDPNEQEFREVFKLKKQFDDEYSMFDVAPADKVAREKRQAAEKEMNEQLKNALGADRYAEYQRAQDWNYQAMYRVTDKYNLPKESAAKVYDMKSAAETEASRIRGDTSLSQEQRTAALRTIRAETEKSMHTVFGDKAWSSYQGQAHWLNGISSSSFTTAPVVESTTVIVTP
jgi:hypothetical protein